MIFIIFSYYWVISSFPAVCPAVCPADCPAGWLRQRTLAANITGKGHPSLQSCHHTSNHNGEVQKCWMKKRIASFEPTNENGTYFTFHVATRYEGDQMHFDHPNDRAKYKPMLAHLLTGFLIEFSSTCAAGNVFRSEYRLSGSTAWLSSDRAFLFTSNISVPVASSRSVAN